MKYNLAIQHCEDIYYSLIYTHHFQKAYYSTKILYYYNTLNPECDLNKIDENW